MSKKNYDSIPDNYEQVVAYDQKRFLKKDPKEMARNTHLNIKENQMIVPLFHREYTVNITDASIAQGDKSNGELPAYERMMILHHLIEAKPHAILQNTFVPLHSLKDAGIHGLAFQNRSLLPLAKTFAGKLDLFLAVGNHLKGEHIDQGDGGFLLYAFPTIPLKVLFWDGDDEVAAAANILFDPSVIEFTHPEDAIGLGDMAADIFIKTAKNIRG